jgi:glutamine cyclotransferase
MFRNSLFLILPLVTAIAAWISFRSNDDLEGQESNSMNAKVKVIATFPHDSRDFCQGLHIEGETVYESTGRYGDSLLKRYDLKTGGVLDQIALQPNYFAEGIAVFENKIYQLTWKERLCVVYDKHTFKPIGQHIYTGQGWGLASDGKCLYMSDGSSNIQVIDPNGFKVLRKVKVTQGKKPQNNLNELEWIGGELWACVWREDRIARIDPTNGQIKGWLDCSTLYPQRTDREHVLNGIAYEPTTKRLFITGKYWPMMYEVEVPRL